LKEYERLMRRMPAKVLEAYEVYQVTKNLAKTAEIVGVHRNTIGKWRKKYEWDKIEELRVKELMETDKDLIEALRKQQMEVVNMLLERAREEIEMGILKIKDVNDLLKALKYQRELAGDNVDESPDVNVMFAIAELHQTINERRRALLYNDGGKDGGD